MTQRYIEVVIGRLVADEDFRQTFVRDPHTALAELLARGTHLTHAEIAALVATEGLTRAGFVNAHGTAPRQTSINHRHPIDWVFVKGATPIAARVERVEATSDHYPLVATITR